MAIGSGNFGAALDPGIRHWYGLTYASWQKEYPMIFNVESSTKSYEISYNASGFGAVPVKSKGGSVSYETASQGWRNVLTNVTYGLGFIIERELWEDDQYSDASKKLPKSLARSVNYTEEVIGANVLNRAFNSSYTGGDGLELCSTAHLLAGGGTWRNELSTAADLDSTSLEQALIDIGDFVDDKSINVAARPKRLIVPTELAFQASKVLGSDKVPEDANNAINPAKGLMPYGVNHYLTDADAWFIVTDVPNGLVYYWRRRPEFTRDNDFDTENGKWKVTFRCVAGWDDPRGIFGSPGA